MQTNLTSFLHQANINKTGLEEDIKRMIYIKLINIKPVYLENILEEEFIKTGL